MRTTTVYVGRLVFVVAVRDLQPNDDERFKSSKQRKPKQRTNTACLDLAGNDDDFFGYRSMVRRLPDA